MKKTASILILLILIVASVFAVDPSSTEAVDPYAAVKRDSVMIISIVRNGISLKEAIQNEITTYGPEARNLYDISASIVGNVTNDEITTNRIGLDYKMDTKTDQNVLVVPNSSFHVTFKLVQNLKVNTNESIDLTIDATPFSTKASGNGDDSTSNPELINCSPQLLEGRTVTYDNVHSFTIKYEMGHDVGENVISYFDLSWPTNPNLRDGTYEASVSLTYVIM